MERRVCLVAGPDEAVMGVAVAVAAPGVDRLCEPRGLGLQLLVELDQGEHPRV